MSLQDILGNFKDAKVLVVGDLMLDQFMWTAVDRISPEAPVPVAHVQSQTTSLGGAANVASNLSAMGVQVALLGRIAKDEAGDDLKKHLEEQHISVDGLTVSDWTPTTLKTRIMAGNHHLLRLDREHIQDLKPEEEKEVLDRFKKYLEEGYSVVIFSDYAKGYISEGFAKEAMELARAKRVRVLSDPTPATFYKFKHSYLVKPNRKEAEAIAGQVIGNKLENLQEVGRLVKEKLEVDELIITLGKDGSAIFKDDGTFERIDTIAREVYEVTGAGDTTIAAIAASLAAGGSLHESGVMGNLAAGIAVAKLGTCRCSKEELAEAIRTHIPHE